MKLAEWLINSGISQSELARRLGVTQGRVSQIVAGAVPSLELATMPHYHPTLAEIWTYPAEELAELL